MPGNSCQIVEEKIFQIQDSKYIWDGADILIDSGMPTCLGRLSRCSNLHDNRTINLLLLSVFHKNTEPMNSWSAGLTNKHNLENEVAKQLVIH